MNSSITYDELVSMRNYIESMIKIHQVEILRILYKNGVYMNENQNGTHINLMDTQPEVLEEVKKYLEYVKYQENSCLLYTSPSPRDLSTSRMPSSA